MASIAIANGRVSRRPHAVAATAVQEKFRELDVAVMDPKTSVMIRFSSKVILPSLALIHSEKPLGPSFVELLIFMPKRLVVNDSGRKTAANIVNFRRRCS
jgi:hypothetical protein